jgi:glyoxylase-like metal-dependent hydrolase (beta-lactamase superfamily II)
MTEFTRRSVLTGAVASAAVLTSTAPLPVQAAAPAAGKQAPSFYRLKVGDFEVTQISDGVAVGQIPAGFVKNATMDEINAALEAAFMPKGQIANQFNPVLVNTGSKLVLLDTGNGQGRSPNTGMLPAGLAAAGVDPKAIDIVVISHFHGDHVGGIRTADGALAFPNAELKVPDDEWAFWMDDGNMSRAPESGPVRNTFQNARRIFGSIADKVTRYKRGSEVAPGIMSIETSGHTPGHASFIVSSGSGKLIVQADVTGNPAINARNPGWHFWADMDGPKAEETRRKLYDMAATDRLPVSGYHYPFPAVAYIEKDGNRYRLVPVAWNPTL